MAHTDDDLLKFQPWGHSHGDGHMTNRISWLTKLDDETSLDGKPSWNSFWLQNGGPARVQLTPFDIYTPL